MQLELFNHELKMLYQALGYAVVNAHTEAETAEFAMLQLKVHHQILVQEELDKKIAEHKKMECVFKYCCQNPPCEGTCYLNRKYENKIN